MSVVGLRSHLAYALSAAERAANRQLTGALAADGVSVEQWRILRALADSPGQRMGELSEAVLMPHPTVTKAVDRLVEAALVYRRHDATDRRRVVVQLSDPGRALLRRAEAAVAAQDRAIMLALGSEQTERLMRDLAQIARIVE